MTTTTTQEEEEELLIIEDDNSIIPTTPIIQEEKIENLTSEDTGFIFGEENKKEEKKEESLGIDLGNTEQNITVEDIFSNPKENLSKKKEDEKKEDEKKEEDNLNFNFSDKEEEIDFFPSNKVEEIQDKKIVKKEEKIEENIPVISAKNLDSDTDNDNDINTILEETIKKLSARKDIIEEIKSETTQEIGLLNKEIKDLQTKVRTHKIEIKNFDKETLKIEENITSLKKMRLK